MSTHFWHPFSNMGRVVDHEVVFVRGEGCELVDRDGRTYLDAAAALWYCNVGYGRTEIAQAVATQIERLHACSCFDIYAAEPTLDLADRVAALAPVDGACVFLTSGGSDSIDSAAKIARRYWDEVGQPEKKVILSREGSYHGMHAYGTSLAGIAANREGYGDLVGGVAQVSATDADALAAAVDSIGANQVAAFFAEPVQGAAGVFPPPDGYLEAAAQICSERDILFVADEVITGFGRTGAMFASDRYNLQPDAIVLAKGITSGYLPLGAVVFSARIAEPFWAPDSNTLLRHGYTYSGHAACCAAALANLDILEQEQLVQRVRDLAPIFASVLGALEDVDGVAEVRSIGLTAGVQLEQAAIDDDPTLGARVTARSRDLGVLTRVLASGALQVSPPFIIDIGQLEQIRDVLGQAILDSVATPVASAR